MVQQKDLESMRKKEIIKRKLKIKLCIQIFVNFNVSYFTAFLIILEIINSNAKTKRNLNERLEINDNKKLKGILFFQSQN